MGTRRPAASSSCRDFDSYYHGYEDGKRTVPGYSDLVDQLIQEFPVGEPIQGEQRQKDFIKLYGSILRLKKC